MAVRVIYPPAAGWPVVLDNSQIEILLIARLDHAASFEVSRGAVCAPAL